MKPKQKILILLPDGDGVSLRNFVFTSFVKVGKEMAWELIFWNHAPFDLSSLGYKKMKLLGNRSMQTGDEVFWLYSKNEISCKMEHVMKQPHEKAQQAHIWFNKINRQPADKASGRILEY